MDSCFNQLSHGSMDEEAQDAVSSSSEALSIVSTESDLFEEITSSAGSSSPTYPSSTSISSPSDPLQDMSSLLQQLPLKRGLSKHYNGKSQSFTFLCNVRCLEDLAKPENPYNKKLKSCKSYGGLLSERHRSNHLPRSSTSSRLISKKGSSSRGSLSSLNNMKRTGSFLGNRLSVPPPPHRSTNTTSFANQTPLFEAFLAQTSLFF